MLEAASGGCDIDCIESEVEGVAKVPSDVVISSAICSASSVVRRLVPEAKSRLSRGARHC